MSSTIPIARGTTTETDAAVSSSMVNPRSTYPNGTTSAATSSSITRTRATSHEKRVFRPRSSTLPNDNTTRTLLETLSDRRSEEHQSNDNYMSEPSLSEDGTGASSSNYTSTLSPINRAIHMTHSHSNTSLSSLGSPNHAAANNANPNSKSARKKIYFSGEKAIVLPKNCLLSPIDGYNEGDSNGGDEIDLMNAPLPDNCKLDTFDDLQQKVEVDNGGAQEDPISNPQAKQCRSNHNLKDTRGEQSADDEQDIMIFQNDDNVPFIKLSGDGMTSDSDGYFAAYDSSNRDDDVDDDDDDEDDNNEDSSGLSYDSSSQEGGEEKSNSNNDVTSPSSKVKDTDADADESCHFLNRALANPKSVDGDEDVLLRNADSKAMDLSLIIHEGKNPYSPDETLLAEMHNSNFMITTPPRITPFDLPEVEESITPKMKTGRPSSIDGLRSSNSDDSGRKTLIKSVSHPTSFDIFDEDDKMCRTTRANSSDKRHHRTRSGDDAAAMILTGSSEWVGMELHKIPLPSERDVDDDEDTVESSNQVINDNAESGRYRRRVRNSQAGMGSDRKNISPDATEFKFHEVGSMKDGISTRFSPRIASDMKFEAVDHFDSSPLRRSQSFGEASVSTADSSFSWISRGTSFVLKESDPQKNSNPTDNNVDERGFLLSSRKTYNSLSSSIPQSANNKSIPLGTQDVLSHVIPDVDGDLEIQEEQTNISGKITVQSKLTSVNESIKFSIGPSKSQAELKKDYPTFTCPKCNTLQREFFTVSSARTRFESPSQYIAIYFFMYMIMSLFIFGMEEGWPPLDCVYFSVITLTTTGLGDYVPNNDTAKIICSIFIYFGVSCIGLLLGSMHASSLDDAAKKQAKENRMSNCIVCARRQGHIGASAYGFGKQSSLGNSMPNSRRNSIKSISSAIETTSLLSLERTTYPISSSWYNTRGSISRLNTIEETQHHGNLSWKPGISPDTSSSQGSAAAPVESTGKQSNKRQYSVEPPAMTNIFDPAYKSSNRRRTETDATGIVSNVNDNNLKTETSTASFTTTGTTGMNFHLFDDNVSDIDNTDNNSQCSGWSTLSHPAEADTEMLRPVSRIKAAKYIFLTLKQAVTNSLFVILIGSVGFYFIEEHMTMVDAFYFTTVLLTTVGYGDIVPKSPEGKMFCTVYSLIAGAVLLHQMSMISMIPLELRKRRIERSVLLQFGNELDDATLEELTTGPLMRRLQLTGNNNPQGLGQCSREAFALAMLVRLGRVSEEDIRSTYAAFNRLDKDNHSFFSSTSSKDTSWRTASTSALDRRRRDAKITIRENGTISLPNKNLNTYDHHQLDSANSEPGRERGMSVESNFSALST
eukprot:CAMPEP_0176496404 /NCGR_PEP_ID=MMETSP0200_2-20121128/11173_1 /TAXON_ID=947934 /ORGANISM="Chaetoceros sp., Strain GSL56" /LENGTH=1333 /DNA_ID=CAMNT_0017894349 /DNA_START=770 /DNA_END=4771 /DNA_ORIENTATION=+